MKGIVMTLMIISFILVVWRLRVKDKKENKEKL